MKSTYLLLAAFCAMLLGGCASAKLETPEGYREYVQDGGFASQSEQVESGMPASEVVALLDKQSQMCLDTTVSVTTTQANGMGGMMQVTETFHLIPEVNSLEAGGGEMVLRRKDENQSFLAKMQLTEEMRKNGYIVLLTDITPEGSGSRVDIYGPSVGYDDVFEAVTAWTTGEHTQCPEL